MLLAGSDGWEPLESVTDPAQQVFLKVEFDLWSFFLHYSQDLDCWREQMVLLLPRVIGTGQWVPSMLLPLPIGGFCQSLCALRSLGVPLLPPGRSSRQRRRRFCREAC